MEVRFHVESETGLPHICSHGVSEAEVREILGRPGLILKGRQESRVALGQTATGRYLKVVYGPGREFTGAFVITAYELRGKELKAYRRRQRRKRR